MADRPSDNTGGEEKKKHKKGKNRSHQDGRPGSSHNPGEQRRNRTGSGRDQMQNEQGVGGGGGGARKKGAYSAFKEKSGRRDGHPGEMQDQYQAQYSMQQQQQQFYPQQQQHHYHQQQQQQQFQQPLPQDFYNQQQQHPQQQQQFINEYMGQRQQQAGQQHRQQDRILRNAGRQQHGGNRPDGQGTANQQGKKKQKPKNGPRKIFEDYWDGEKLQQGLKRGELIQGPVRINPRNYMDAYVPHPDGVSDVYLSGMPDRNRALNGDIVAVMIYPREKWKVFVEDMNLQKKSLEAAFSDMKLDSKEDSEKKVEEKVMVVEKVEAEKSVQKAKSEDEDENGPDVIIEEEVTDDSDEEGNAGKLSTETENSTACDNSAKKSTDCEGAKQGGAQVGTKPRDSAQAKSKQTPSKSACKQNKQEDKPAKNAPRGNAAYTPAKKFATLEDLWSPDVKVDSAVKRLFVEEEGEERKKKMDAVPDKFLLRTGKVVAIIEQKHSRAATGTLKPMQDRNPTVALFSPLDHRVPRIHVARTDWPDGFAERPQDFAKTLFVARITRWEDCYNNAHGALAKSLGEAGEIEPETTGILMANDVDCEEFKPEAIECLPDVSNERPWKIPEQEFTYRRDFRKHCVFTIDPATARDLDDALHVIDLGDGVYEVGVHIADVSFFVDCGNELDKVAASRATSVYLVQKVIPMLPRLLCEQLCSLNPDEDRLTFSVVWKMRETGEILEEWFGRSVIRSCVKLSYDHAQGFIEQPQRDWSEEELPPISENFSVPQIRQSVLNLNKIAQNLRRHRFDSGALRLDQVKISYNLDKETGMPNGYYVYQARDSNKLVEEFMLLANMAVAHKIYRKFPELSTLRRHPEPQGRMIDELVSVCSSLGINLDASSSGAIHRSIMQMGGADLDDIARTQIMTVLCSKPMQNALYFCTGMLSDESLYRHYALNVPLYTHFTSPIRRYPDLMVHRILGAALDYCEVPDVTKEEIQRECSICNDKKLAAKTCSDLSSELFFAIFVKESGPMEEEGMVMAVLDKSFDVLILKLGVVKRVYCEQLPLEGHVHHMIGKRPDLKLMWKQNEFHPKTVEQTITIFTRVNCVLQAGDEALKWGLIIKHPDEPGCTGKEKVDENIEEGEEEEGDK